MSRNEEERIQELEKAVNKSHAEGYFGDLNDINTTGVVYAGAGATNKPGSGAYGANNGYCTTLFFMNGYKKQIYYLQNNTNYCYERTCNNGVWTEWTGPESLNVDQLLRHGWVIHTTGTCNIFKDKHVVHLQLCVREGTKNTILQLPIQYRPKTSFFFPANTEGGVGSYAHIDTNGIVSTANAIVGKLIFINISYEV